MENKDAQKHFKVLIHKETGHYGEVDKFGYIRQSYAPQLLHWRETIDHIRKEIEVFRNLNSMSTMDESIVSDIFSDDYILEEFVVIKRSEYEKDNKIN